MHKLTACVLLTLALAGCGSSDPIRMTTLQLGKSINPDRTVATHTTRFKPTDTIYASVLTEGSGAATISVRWQYAGRVVSEPKKDVSYKGAAATEFHLENSAGFPPGDYAVEIFVDGKSVASRDFKVER
jgi:hypothetical protein